jgi:hypothetical protein
MTAAGVLTAQYGPASTFSSLTCSGNVMCEQSAGAPSWPENSTRLSAIAVADNAFKSVTRQTFIQKNLFEIKQARDVLLEGNVLEDQWTTDAGTYCALLFTPRSERGTVPQAAAENVIFRNNIVRNTMCGISMIGADDFEGGIYGVGRNLLFQNNLFEVVSTRRHGVSSSSEGMLFRGGVKFKGVELSHNTVVEIDGALASFIDNPGRDPVELHLKNNLVVPRAREEGETSAPFPVIQGTSTAGWRDAKTRFNPDGTLAGIVLLNRNNWGNARNIRDNYPTDSNYLMLPGESLASVCFKGYEHGDYRLCRSAACGTLSPFSAVVDEVRSTSGRDIGADIDEIEALTRGVVEGIPEFAQRAAVQVAVEGTKATLTWTAPSEEACRVQVYDSPEYKKLTSDVDPGRFENADLDSRPGVYADGLRRSFTIGTLEPLEPGKKYHYKLFCGSEIATGSFETQP